MKNDVLRETFITNQQEAEVSRVKCEQVTLLKTANIITSTYWHFHVHITCLLPDYLTGDPSSNVAAFANVTQLDISGQFVAMSGILTEMRRENFFITSVFNVILN